MCFKKKVTYFLLYSLTFMLHGDPIKAFQLKSYVICTIPRMSSVAQKWVEHLELELELSADVLIKKCAKENQREKQRESADVLIEIRAHSSKKNNYEIQVEAKKRFFLQREISEKDLTKQNAVLFAREILQKKEEKKQSEIPQLKVIETAPITDIKVLVKEEPDSVKTEKPSWKLQDRQWFMNTQVGGESLSYRFYPTDRTLVIPAIATRLYPRFLLQVEWWPYSWMGVGVNGSFALSVFRMDISGIGVLESQRIWARHYQGETFLKARTLFSSGLGLGIKAGYWHQTGMVDPQMVAGKTYTQIPSSQLHAFEIGGEIFFQAHPKKIDLSLEILLLPCVSYKESPDVVGQLGARLGLSTQFVFRYFLHSNWFLLLSFRGIGLYGVFEGVGNRITVNDELISGGALLTYMLTGTAGIGWTF